MDMNEIVQQMGQLGQQFKMAGKIQPWKPTKTAEHVAETKHTIERDNDKFSIFKLWVSRPSLQFPEAGLFIKIQSGDRSMFFKINPENIAELSGWLMESLPIMQDALISMEPESNLCKEQCREYWEKRKGIEETQQLADTMRQLNGLTDTE